MLERLIIEETSYITSNEIRIWIEDDRVHYSLDFLVLNRHVKDEISGVSPESLESMLSGIGIERWKKRHEPEFAFMDGVSWSVKLKKSGEKEIKRSGENEWPANWRRFLMTVKAVTGDLGNMDGEEDGDF